ncbi:MAG: DegV family protein [Eubacteriales bacterium]|nr:DegV family protein [Eubacteriales bacterium]
MIRILVDSAADLPMEELVAKNITLTPLTVTVGEESFKDEVELKREKLYEYLLDGSCTVKTSQPSPQDFLDAFESAKEAGDELICILLSSALSGTYQSACLAKNMADYDKIYLIDSLSATVGIKILADKALAMIAEGQTSETIVETLEELKGRIRIKAAIDTLKYLYLGGRVSKTTALVADTVNIKPSITLNPEGEVAVVGKYLGVGRAVKDLVKQMKAANVDENYKIYGIYSHDKTNADKLIKALNAAGIEVEDVYHLGATLGVHVGPGAFGIIYIEKNYSNLFKRS